MRAPKRTRILDRAGPRRVCSGHLINIVRQPFAIICKRKNLGRDESAHPVPHERGISRFEVSHPCRDTTAPRMGHPAFNLNRISRSKSESKNNRRSFDSLRYASVAQDDRVLEKRTLKKRALMHHALEKGRLQQTGELAVRCGKVNCQAAGIGANIRSAERLLFSL
jgi:hypothetical protein